VKKYLVVSYDPDQQQWHYDVIFAGTEDAAKERILTIRDYCVDADAISMDDLQRMTTKAQEETLHDSERWMAELADERDADEDARAKAK
jgi:hypothetical protein